MSQRFPQIPLCQKCRCSPAVFLSHATLLSLKEVELHVLSELTAVGSGTSVIGGVLFLALNHYTLCSRHPLIYRCLPAQVASLPAQN